MPHGEIPIMGKKTNLGGVSCFAFLPDDMIFADSNPALNF